MPAEVTNTEASTAVLPNSESANAGNNAPARTEKNNREDSDDELEDHKGSVVPRAPDGGWGWIVVLGSFMSHAIFGGIVFSFGVFVEDFVEHFECSKSAVGGLGSLMFGVAWGSGNIVLCVFCLFAVWEGASFKIFIRMATVNGAILEFKTEENQ